MGFSPSALFSQPIKQWDVAREYRRRFKQALQDSEMALPIPQRDIWLRPTDDLPDRPQGSILAANQHDRACNGHRSQAKTDLQPKTVPSGADEAENERECGKRA